jgi:putative oxidoreductase
MGGTKDGAVLAGRILVAALFLISGIGKTAGFAGTAALMGSKGLPAAEVLLVATIVIELGGGVAIIAGWKTGWAAIALFLFTGIATVVFHNFWLVPADQAQMQQIQFMKNVAIMGGLLVLFGGSPGRFAADRGAA